MCYNYTKILYGEWDTIQYMMEYDSPVGKILLAADDTGITGLWFAGQKYYADNMSSVYRREKTEILELAEAWLDIYFTGAEPDFTVPLHLMGTPFQLAVWECLRTVPYGETVTYGDIARSMGVGSARAVGGAVGRNPVSVLVPCHRVIGANGALTGYAGGLERKRALLELESLQKSI